MATKKTILLIEVDNEQYHASYSGKLEPDWLKRDTRGARLRKPRKTRKIKSVQVTTR